MDKKEFEEIKKKFEGETQQKKISKFLNYTSLLVATLGAVIISSNFVKNFSSDYSSDFTEKVSNSVLKNQIIVLKSELLKSKKIVDSLKRSSKDNTKLSESNVALTDLKKEVENLNKVILDNPEKAISVPLLKIEIENQKEQNEKELKSLKDDIARVYDMNKWIIGLVFTMLVSIIVLNISNLFAKNKKE